MTAMVLHTGSTKINKIQGEANIFTYYLCIILLSVYSRGNTEHEGSIDKGQQPSLGNENKSWVLKDAEWWREVCSACCAHKSQWVVQELLWMGENSWKVRNMRQPRAEASWSVSMELCTAEKRFSGVGPSALWVTQHIRSQPRIFTQGVRGGVRKATINWWACNAVATEQVLPWSVYEMKSSGASGWLSRSHRLRTQCDYCFHLWRK